MTKNVLISVLSIILIGISIIIGYNRYEFHTTSTTVYRFWDDKNISDKLEYSQVAYDYKMGDYFVLAKFTDDDTLYKFMTNHGRVFSIPETNDNGSDKKYLY